MDIICIDDQVDVQDLMSMTLEDELNATVHCFGTSHAAHNFLKSTKLNIRVILCDYNLEDKTTGIDFSNVISAFKKPFVLITGMCFSADDTVFNTFLDRPECSVMYKPFSDDDLIEKIKDLTKV